MESVLADIKQFNVIKQLMTLNDIMTLNNSTVSQVWPVYKQTVYPCETELADGMSRLDGRVFYFILFC